MDKCKRENWDFETGMKLITCCFLGFSLVHTADDDFCIANAIPRGTKQILMIISSKGQFSRTTSVISCSKMYILDCTYGKCQTIWHKRNPRFFILQMSHHAAQNIILVMAPKYCDTSYFLFE